MRPGSEVIQSFAVLLPEPGRSRPEPCDSAGRGGCEGAGAAGRAIRARPTCTGTRSCGHFVGRGHLRRPSSLAVSRVLESAGPTATSAAAGDEVRPVDRASAASSSLPRSHASMRRAPAVARIRPSPPSPRCRRAAAPSKPRARSRCSSRSRRSRRSAGRRGRRAGDRAEQPATGDCRRRAAAGRAPSRAAPASGNGDGR